RARLPPGAGHRDRLRDRLHRVEPHRRPAVPVPGPPSGGLITMRDLVRSLRGKSSPGLFITTCVTFLVICFIFIYPLVTDVSPFAQDVQNAFAPAFTPDHPLGTDNLGRDAFARLVFGLRTELIVCAAGTLLAGVVGTLIGILAA